MRHVIDYQFNRKGKREREREREREKQWEKGGRGEGGSRRNIIFHVLLWRRGTCYAREYVSKPQLIFPNATVNRAPCILLCVPRDIVGLLLPYHTSKAHAFMLPRHFSRGALSLSLSLSLSFSLFLFRSRSRSFIFLAFSVLATERACLLYF